MSTSEIQAILAARARRYREGLADDDVRTDRVEMALFRRAGSAYGVPIARLSSIHRAATLTSLPGLSGAVKGLANVRGRLVAVHDLGSFAKEPHPLGEELWLLVCGGRASGVALLADGVDEVRSIDVSRLAEPPLSLSSIRGCFVGFDPSGVGYVDLDQLLLTPAFFQA